MEDICKTSCTYFAHGSVSSMTSYVVNMHAGDDELLPLKFFHLCLQKSCSFKHGKDPFEEITPILNGLCNYVQLFGTVCDSNFTVNCRVWIRQHI